jgi:oxygen-independent coproporphyrinogen-3 oxidase
VTFSPPTAAYVHVPFCRHRCGYCNFTLIAGRDDLIEAYLEGLAAELSRLETPRPVQTLFLGGGTPTHLAPPQLQRLLRLARQWFPLAPGYEFSAEANPADVTPERIAVLQAAGLTRLSVGVQSFHAEKLKLLERDHTADTAREAIRFGREAGFSTSLDLIFGAPGETLEQWHRDLDEALALETDHVSLYGLTYERGTSFWTRKLKGELRQAEEELEREMYLAAIDRLSAAGYEHYEVSNFAKPGRRCRHNETYWAAEGYYAAGPGAARYVDGRRETNHRSTTTWLERIRSGKSPVAESETLEPEDRAREALVLGLRRLREGIVGQAFSAQFGYDLATLGGRELEKLLESKLLQLVDDRLTLTREGLLISDWIWSKFVRC